LPLGDEEPLDDDLSDAVLGTPGLADGDRERRLLEQVLHAAEEAARRESKIARLRRLLSRAREPVIVFTEYRDTLTRLRQALSGLRIQLSVLHGGQSATERDAVQRHFNATGGVLLATDAAAEGLNLHAACRFVVHFELPWSPGRLEQRAGRVDRIGQQRRVHEMALVASDTAERLVLVPLARRLARARRDLVAGAEAKSYLSEAAVAAAVLDGAVADLDGQGVAPPALYVEPPAALARTGAAEAERLAVLRSWRSASSARRRHRRSLPVTTVRAATIPGGLVAVYAMSLTSATGRLVHSELGAVHVCAGITPPRRAAVARQHAEDALHRDRGRLRQAVEHATSARLDEIAAAYIDAARRLAARERTLLEGLASASRQLLQAGLFDTRAADDHHRRLQSRSNSAAESDRRIGELAGSPPTRSLELVAMLLACRSAGRR
jgi:hypothetical protein